jgi:hypothetical protein
MARDLKNGKRRPDGHVTIFHADFLENGQPTTYFIIGDRQKVVHGLPISPDKFPVLVLI